MVSRASEMSESELVNYHIDELDEGALQARGMVEEVENPTIHDSHRQDGKEELPAEYPSGRIDTCS